MSALTLELDNSFIRELPGDDDDRNVPRHVRGACWSNVSPTPVAGPELVAHAAEVAALIGLTDEDCLSAEFAAVFAGNDLAPGMVPTAACYGGHQFGHWAGQLGDGRAISLGEVVNATGERWELQLKGAGRTPYSRMGDGRAVLRSSIREFLCSEAMHHLGVPTTRALSLVTTGDEVIRDMLYDGNPRPEPGAIVCRVSPSFLRFGSYEIFAARDEHGLLRSLADYTLRTHFPHLLDGRDGAPGADTYVAWLREVARTTAEMIVHWMRVGFVHGVMNTDNMSILGLTIDYGPYGWLDDFDPGWTPNTTDAEGRRYAYGKQPGIALWNLVRFAQAIVPLIGDPSPLEDALGVYGATFEAGHRRMMNDKLGLAEPRDDDDELVDELMRLLVRAETDMTIFYRRLAEVPTAEGVAGAERIAPLLDAYYAAGPTEEVRAALVAWVDRWAARARSEGRPDAARRAAMNAVNPKFVLRNCLAQLAIDDAENGDPTRVRKLLDIMRRPYDEQPEEEAVYAAKRPDWARNRPGCSMLSCSS